MMLRDARSHLVYTKILRAVMCGPNNSLKEMGLRARQVGPESIPRELQRVCCTAVLISYLKNITPHDVQR